jgi:hypothetical protein
MVLMPIIMTYDFYVLRCSDSSMIFVIIFTPQCYMNTFKWYIFRMLFAVKVEIGTTMSSSSQALELLSKCTAR